jgi:hypothetical protein
MSEANNAIQRKIRDDLQQKIISNKLFDYKRNQANQFITNLWSNPKLGNVRFKINRFKKNPRSRDFLHVEDFLNLIDVVSPLGNLKDAMHCVIMNHFGIKKILTFNVNDFRIFEEAMENIEAINPDEIDQYLGGD